MDIKIENDVLEAVISSSGAELISLKTRKDGTERIWQADPEIWKRHAPVLFPYTGKLREGHYFYNGEEYKGGQHGFARDVEHQPVEQSRNNVVFLLRSNSETRERYPFDFELYSSYSLNGNSITHKLTVKNTGTDDMRFGIGYHPAFICPFDDRHDTEDYLLEFDVPQTPRIVKMAEGYTQPESSWERQSEFRTIQLTDHLFDNDSICYTDLTAGELSLVEKDTGRRISVSIKGYPYVLIWSSMTPKLRFVCIEPWRSINDTDTTDCDWNKKPCACELPPDGTYSTEITAAFDMDPKPQTGI
mgnify:FL=1|jgi:galactose mutarotase-like enzyme